MAPGWLTVVAWISLSVCFSCAGIISYDIVANHRRQPMGVMNFVFPITALYFGPLAVALYWRWGRAAAPATAASMPMSMAAVAAAHAHSGGVDGAARPGPPGESPHDRGHDAAG